MRRGSLGRPRAPSPGWHMTATLSGLVTAVGVLGWEIGTLSATATHNKTARVSSQGLKGRRLFRYCYVTSFYVGAGLDSTDYSRKILFETYEMLPAE